MTVHTEPLGPEGRAEGDRGWAWPKFVFFKFRLPRCMAVCWWLKVRRGGAAAAGAFVPVSKEPAPLLQASSPSINIGRVNTSALLQPRYRHYHSNTATTWVKKSLLGLDRDENLAESCAQLTKHLLPGYGSRKENKKNNKKLVLSDSHPFLVRLDSN